MGLVRFRQLDYVPTNTQTGSIILVQEIRVVGDNKASYSVRRTAAIPQYLSTVKFPILSNIEDQGAEGWILD